MSINVGAGVYGSSSRREMETNESINGGFKLAEEGYKSNICRFSEERINYVLSFSPVSFYIIYDGKDKIWYYGWSCSTQQQLWRCSVLIIVYILFLRPSHTLCLHCCDILHSGYCMLTVLQLQSKNVQLAQEWIIQSYSASTYTICHRFGIAGNLIWGEGNQVYFLIFARI